MAVAPAHSGASRRILYGVNAVFQAALVLAVAILVIYFAQRFRAQWDVSRSGVNTLSPRTIALLRSIPEDVKITALYTVLSEYDTLAQKRQNLIRDMLALYDGGGGAKVATYLIDPMKDPGRLPGVLKELKEKPAYQDEAKPHEAAVAEFVPLNQKVQELAASEFARLDQFLQANPQLGEMQGYAGVRAYFQRLGRQSEDVGRQVQELIEGEIPRYGQAAEAINRFVGGVRSNLEEAANWMARNARALPNAGDDLTNYLAGAKNRFGPLLGEAESLTASTEGLKRVKLEELYEELSRWASAPPILVETRNEARVVPFFDVWPFRTDPNAPESPDGDNRDFNGESAISSAILALTEKERTAIVFTRYGGQSPIEMDPMALQMAQMSGQLPPPPPYRDLNEQLQRANFLTADWDVSRQKTPPVIEDAKRLIYLVFPPEPPPRPNPMQPSPERGMTPEDRKIVTDAIGSSGKAVFLAGWAPPPMAGIPMAGGSYEYAEYLRDEWGVDVKFQHLALKLTLNAEKGLWIATTPSLTTEFVRFTDHPIGKVLQSVSASFHMVCPVTPASDAMPDGVTVAVVAETKPSEDVWTIDDIERLRNRDGTTPTSTSIRSPFSIVVAAEKASGQKVVVFGSERFASDEIAQQRGLAIAGGSLVQFVINPANTDLLLNAFHWLTGESDRIAVGPRRNDIPRLSGLKDDATLKFCRVFMVGLWPALALLLGGVVWLVRRR